MLGSLCFMLYAYIIRRVVTRHASYQFTHIYVLILGHVWSNELSIKIMIQNKS